MTRRKTKTKCDLATCRNRARVKVSTSFGWVGQFCYRHAFQLIKRQLVQASESSFGIYIQGLSAWEREHHEIAPEARPYVHTPEDRAKRAEDERRDDWDF